MNNNINLQLLKYYYEHKVYDLNKMILFVNNNIISKQEFFDVTRLVFDTVKQEDI